MLCPIVNAGRKEGEPAVPCAESNCAWWVQGKRNPGCCAAVRLVHYMAGALALMRKKPVDEDDRDDDLGRVNRELDEEVKP